MFEKILVPLDGSQLAERVLPYATELAGAFASEVVLLEVCHPEEKEGLTAIQQYLGRQVEALKTSLGGSECQVRWEVLEGSPAHQIIVYAGANAVDLVIVSSHGRSGLLHWSRGSTAEKLLGGIRIPLLIVRAKEGPMPASGNLFSRILVPLDGSRRAEAALPYATELARRSRATLLLLRVAETGRYVHSIRGVEHVVFKDHDLGEMKKSARSYLEETASRLDGTGATSIEVRDGEAAPEILRFATETDCRLIVMASHGHSGVEAWTIGSVTRKVLHDTGIPLLVVRADKAS